MTSSSGAPQDVKTKRNDGMPTSHRISSHRSDGHLPRLGALQRTHSKTTIIDDERPNAASENLVDAGGRGYQDQGKENSKDGSVAGEEEGWVSNSDNERATASEEDDPSSRPSRHRPSNVFRKNSSASTIRRRSSTSIHQTAVSSSSTNLQDLNSKDQLSSQPSQDSQHVQHPPNAQPSRDLSPRKKPNMFRIHSSSSDVTQNAKPSAPSSSIAQVGFTTKPSEAEDLPPQQSLPKHQNGFSPSPRSRQSALPPLTSAATEPTLRHAQHPHARPSANARVHLFPSPRRSPATPLPSPPLTADSFHSGTSPERDSGPTSTTTQTVHHQANLSDQTNGAIASSPLVSNLREDSHPRSRLGLKKDKEIEQPSPAQNDESQLFVFNPVQATPSADSHSRQQSQGPPHGRSSSHPLRTSSSRSSIRSLVNRPQLLPKRLVSLSSNIPAIAPPQLTNDSALADSPANWETSSPAGSYISGQHHPDAMGSLRRTSVSSVRTATGSPSRFFAPPGDPNQPTWGSTDSTTRNRDRTASSASIRSNSHSIYGPGGAGSAGGEFSNGASKARGAMAALRSSTHLGTETGSASSSGGGIGRRMVSSSSTQSLAEVASGVRKSLIDGLSSLTSNGSDRTPSPPSSSTISPNGGGGLNPSSVSSAGRAQSRSATAPTYSRSNTSFLPSSSSGNSNSQFSLSCLTALRPVVREQTMFQDRPTSPPPGAPGGPHLHPSPFIEAHKSLWLGFKEDGRLSPMGLSGKRVLDQKRLALS
ncbi:hypothetical protein [Phaffia rhodozyma]|uniref:Uncharacterized protein n=1 Tax=Phaffia rhodozyma TaxID=264483 RepID=A0A0F7SM15_PHARH|nr:hypothetical protein [Phaffia rhodozyma]